MGLYPGKRRTPTAGTRLGCQKCPMAPKLFAPCLRIKRQHGSSMGPQNGPAPACIDVFLLPQSFRHGHKNTVLDIKWNQNGKWLLTCGKDQVIKLYDIRKLEELQTFKGHKKDITSISNFLIVRLKLAPISGVLFC